MKCKHTSVHDICGHLVHCRGGATGGFVVVTFRNCSAAVLQLNSAKALNLWRTPTWSSCLVQPFLFTGTRVCIRLALALSRQFTLCVSSYILVNPLPFSMAVVPFSKYFAVIDIESDEEEHPLLAVPIRSLESYNKSWLQHLPDKALYMTDEGEFDCKIVKIDCNYIYLFLCW